jgi:hypothetical protein
VVEQQGYRILSGDTMHPTSLFQMPAHVDVYSSYQPVRVRSNQDIESDIAAHLQSTALVGVVVHPLSLPRNSGKQLRELLRNNVHRMISHLPS